MFPMGLMAPFSARAPLPGTALLLTLLPCFAPFARNTHPHFLHRTIESGLFLFNPPLRKALLTVRNMTYPLASTGMLALPKNEIFDLEDFVRAQALVHDDLRIKLRILSTNVLTTVRGACDEVVDQFLKINSIAANHKMTFMERASLR